LLETNSQPPEILKSIYEFDRDYQETAQRAAENYVALFWPGSVVRWRPVRLETEAFLSGSYLDDGAITTSFKISPFPDTVFTVVEDKYTIMKGAESLFWEGSIVGSDYGRVEITIVGGTETPGFIIRIIDGSKIFSIAPTETPDVYVALEGNPHQPTPTL